MIIGKGNTGQIPLSTLKFRYKAVKNCPVPKKAVDPNEIYPVRPEKKYQLIVRAVHMRVVLKTDT
jgi:hypothetical protein